MLNSRGFAKHILLIQLFLLASFSAKASAQSDLLAPHLRDLLHEELSGELAKEHVIQITRHHRIQGSRGYRDAANYALAQLRSFGFSEKEAFIESFPSDGKIHYQTWQSPSGWDIDWGELRMLKPHDERIVGYPEIGMSVITYSNPGDVTAELVWVGSGTKDSDYEGKNVKGKFVLATGYGGAVHRKAVLKYGARAVVCYLADERAKDHPDMLQYTGMWPKSDELESVTFGFNLTNRQGERLRKMLESGTKVVLRGQVKGRGLEPYFMDVVVARIRGSEKPDEELVFSAHLDHPKESANDNASGSAALLDMARSLRTLIDQGRLPRPRRSLRFIWVPEWFGAMAYIDRHPEMKGRALGGKFLANINMDMVGENTELLHSKMEITRTPDSMPSVLNDVVENMARMVDKMRIRTPRGSQSIFNYRITPYSGGSDHMMFIERKIPGVMFSHAPDYTHHTSEDTPDKVDPVELERAEIIASASMLYLANLDARQATELAYIALGNSSARLARAMRKATQITAGATDGDTAQLMGEAATGITEAAKRENEALASLNYFNDAPAIMALVRQIQEELLRQAQSYNRILAAAASERGIVSAGMDTDQRDTRVPVRLTRGPLEFSLPESRLSAAERKWYGSADFPFNPNQRFELVNFIDGKRTVAEIRDALSAEFQPVAQAIVARYLEDLVKTDALKWK